MTPSQNVRRVVLAIIGLVLLFLAWVGITGGFGQIAESKTPGQIAQTITQFGYGIFALLSLLTTFWARHWNRVMLRMLTISLTLAAGLASVAWGGSSLLIGLVSAAGAFLIGLAIAWLLRFGARSVTHQRPRPY